MAYNILKGTVEGSVDQHADQEIGGVKIFKNTVSASVFYDTDAQSPCATLKDVAITDIKGAAKNSVLIADKETGARSYHDFTYDGKSLCANIIKAKLFEGDAGGLSNLPTNRFDGKIAATFIEYGPGLKNIRGSLQLNIGDGLHLDGEKVEISVGIKSGLSHRNSKLIIDPSKAEPINNGGQNLTDQDMLIVADVSRSSTNSTTLGNLYKNYINPRIPHAAGIRTQLQFKGDNEFESSPNLTFEPTSNLLNVEGKVRADSIQVEETLICHGAVRHNIIRTTEAEYEIQPNDYTVLCGTEKNKITVKLPPACNNLGRVLVIKKADSNKYKLTSNILKITCEEGSIDINNELTVKMNYSHRTLQSDGENWWVIGSRGT